MEGILKLNVLDPIRNPAFGSHDPGMMYDPKSKKYYSYSTDVYMPKYGLKDQIGIPVRVSEDLIHFTYRGTVLSPEAIREGRRNEGYPPTYNFWAPFGEYVAGEYRLYYSATRRFGSSESRIWLATADSPLGPFRNRGIVVDSWGTDDTKPNAIDPHIIRGEGRCWLVYGSFFGGICLKELDDATGLPLDGDPRALGSCISQKASPPILDGPEGAAVIYCPETGYYYLFQSYDWLGDGYDIRVGRSRSPQGPYLNYEGKSLRDGAMGLKIANSYRFSAKAPHAEAGESWAWAGLRGPGHGVPFFDPVGKRYFFIHHIRDGEKVHRRYDSKFHRYYYPYHYMMIRAMSFVEDWPVLSPEPYIGESEKSVPPESGVWEILRLDDGNGMKYPETILLEKKAPIFQCGVCRREGDFENGGTVLTVTGITPDGCAFWGKRLRSFFYK